MVSTITATIDGQEFTVDLHRITALDALSFWGATGIDLDDLVTAWAGGAPTKLKDSGVVKWLWFRQNGEPLAPLTAVAFSVTLLPEPVEDPAPSGAAVDAPEAG